MNYNTNKWKDISEKSNTQKKKIISEFKSFGWNTSATVFENIRFLIADGIRSHGKEYPCPTAFALLDDNMIVINPSFFLDGPYPNVEMYRRQVVHVVRHEVLHIMLQHLRRTFQWIEKEAGSDALKKNELTQRLFGPYRLENLAADQHLSQFYTNDEVDLFNNLCLNGEIVKCLVLETDHPEWLGLNYEDLLNKVANYEHLSKEEKDAFDNSTMTIVYKKGQRHSDEYTDMYNDIISKYIDASDEDIARIIASIHDGTFNGEL